MPLYQYKAVAPGGRRKKGAIDAPSLAEAKEKLRQQKVMVTALVLRRERVQRNALRGQARVSFTLQLSQLIASGLPIFESLVALEEQLQTERYHSVVLSLCDQIRTGTALSVAMSRHPESFDTLYCAMVAAGEASGSLGEGLARLADLLASKLRLKKQMSAALTYPLIIAIFCTLVTYLLLTFAIPSMAALFGDRELNGYTRIVLAFSHFLSTSWPIYLPLLAGIAIALWSYFRSPRGVASWRCQMLKLPLLKTLALRSAWGRWCHTLSTLLGGGVPLIDALKLSRGVLLNPILENGMQRAEERIVEGSTLSEQLKQEPYAPKLLIRMVAVGEESGSLSTMLQQAAELYDAELERSLTKLTTWIQPTVLLLMGGVVGLIMLAVLLPLTDLSAIF